MAVFFAMGRIVRMLSMLKWFLNLTASPRVSWFRIEAHSRLGTWQSRRLLANHMREDSMKLHARQPRFEAQLHYDKHLHNHPIHLI